MFSVLEQHDRGSYDLFSCNQLWNVNVIWIYFIQRHRGKQHAKVEVCTDSYFQFLVVLSVSLESGVGRLEGVANGRELGGAGGQSWECRGQTLAAVAKEMEGEALSTLGEQGDCNSIQGPLCSRDLGLQTRYRCGDGVGGAMGRTKHDRVQLFGFYGNSLASRNGQKWR